MPRDPRYTADVGGIKASELPDRLRTAIKDLEAQFPGLGVTLFVFEFGGPGKGIGYVSNGEREGMIDTIEEWLRMQKAGRN